MQSLTLRSVLQQDVQSENTCVLGVILVRKLPTSICLISKQFLSYGHIEIIMIVSFKFGIILQTF